MKLHCGCGHHHMEGWLNADLYPTAATDMVFSLESPWPVRAESMNVVYASHVVEHLSDWRTFFAEAWKVLTPEGQLQVRVPYGMHPAAWWDMGHMRPWVTEAFAFFQPGYSAHIGNPQHDDWQYPYQVLALHQRLGHSFMFLLNRKWKRRIFLKYMKSFVNSIEELFIYMQPLKSLDAVLRFRALNPGTHLPSTFCVWRHHYEGRVLESEKELQLIILGQGVTANGYD